MRRKIDVKRLTDLQEFLIETLCWSIKCAVIDMISDDEKGFQYLEKMLKAFDIWIDCYNAIKEIISMPCNKISMN